jgi:hypothetical protein
VSARGGAVIRFVHRDEEVHAFVPADVVLRVAEISAFRAVDGLAPPATGIAALADGEVVTVLALSSTTGPATRAYRPDEDWPVPGADRALLCAVGGARVAVVGATIVATGLFEESFDAVMFRDRIVPVLDVRALYAQAEAATWARRAVVDTADAVMGPPSLRPVRHDEAHEREAPSTRRTEEKR